MDFRVRYTPTCVGKTAYYARDCTLLTVHPHMCGENDPVSHAAVAAKTVHPHMCGENFFRFIIAAIQKGTPPHVWGKLKVAQPEEPLTRYTPTCVGKTDPHMCRWLILAVHPHMCGENWQRRWRPAQWEGTPPHVWGKRCKPIRYGLPTRYTPTCVGKTDFQETPPLRSPVHPHMCGENGVVVGW